MDIGNNFDGTGITSELMDDYYNNYNVNFMKHMNDQSTYKTEKAKYTDYYYQKDLFGNVYS